MQVSFFLKRPNSPTSSVFTVLNIDGKPFKYYLPKESSIEPRFWNPDTQRARQSKSFPQFPEYNRRLDGFASLIDSTILELRNEKGNSLTRETLRERLDEQLKPGKVDKGGLPKTFFEYFEHFNERSKSGQRVNINSAQKNAVKYNTNKGFKTTLNHLKNFAKANRKRIDFETIDIAFYNDYTEYLTMDLGLSVNTVGDHIKRIKVVMNEATDNGINTNLQFRRKDFAKKTEESFSIYLNESELQQLRQLDLSNKPHLCAARDLYLIGCYTGQRFSDWATITSNDISKGIIYITQEKTTNTIAIPIHPVVKQIFGKWNGKLPDVPTNHEMNRHLKTIGEMLPFMHELVTYTKTVRGKKVEITEPKLVHFATHTARRSFATNEYLAGLPTLTIMAITGHRTERSFLKYIKVTPDEHANIMLAAWAKRSHLMVV